MPSARFSRHHCFFFGYAPFQRNGRTCAPMPAAIAHVRSSLAESTTWTSANALTDRRHLAMFSSSFLVITMTDTGIGADRHRSRPTPGRPRESPGRVQHEHLLGRQKPQRALDLGPRVVRQDGARDVGVELDPTAECSIRFRSITTSRADWNPARRRSPP